MLISILQGRGIRDKEEFMRLIDKNDIKIGTVLRVPPALPILSCLYYHFIMIYEVYDYGIKFIHLKKSFFIKRGEIVDVPFTKLESYLKFNYFVYIHLTLDKLDINAMYNRINYLLKKNHINYGLNSKFTFNCESFIYYLLFGIIKQSSEVKKIEEKNGTFGLVTIRVLDNIFNITNFIGEIHSFMKNSE